MKLTEVKSHMAAIYTSYYYCRHE